MAYFPIKVEPSCRLKWAWSTIYLNNGSTGSCHRASQSVIESITDFHNTPQKIQDRELMLSGKWPGAGCEYCKNIEDSNGVSDRQFQNQIPDVYPAELDIDPTATKVDPVVLEVFFSNTCNLKCVYCNAKFSSAIQQENASHGKAIIPILEHTYADNRYRELAPQFWQWFNKHSHKLKRFQVLGGEPFLQSDVSKLYQYFDEHPHPNLEFNLVTNLSVSPKLLKQHLFELAKLLTQNKLGRVDILASVDSWGPAQEYVRYGFKRTVFEENLKLLQEFNVFRVGILTTVNTLSINEMPALAEKMLEWNKTSTVHWYMHLVLPEGESLFDPLMFDYKNFATSLHRVEELLPNDTWDQKRTVEVFTGIKNKLADGCIDNLTKQESLYSYLNQIDERRSLNWKQTFNWITSKYVV